MEWSGEKNAELKETRGISFEEITLWIEQGGLFGTVDHPNQAKYPGRQMFVVRCGYYVYLGTPFVESENEYFLKTIIPSRKATRQYLREGSDK